MKTKKEFFKAEYLKTEDGVIPTIWLGNQGFDLTEKYDDVQTAQKNAEWFVSMFKKAIDSYAEHYHKAKVEAVNPPDEEHNVEYTTEEVEEEATMWDLAYTKGWNNCKKQLLKTIER